MLVQFSCFKPMLSVFFLFAFVTQTSSKVNLLSRIDVCWYMAHLKLFALSKWESSVAA